MDYNKNSKSKRYRGRRAAAEYNHTGITYTWLSPRKQVLIKLWLCGAGAFAAQLAAGFIPYTRLEDRAWVLLPYAAGLLLTGALLWHIFELTDGGDPMHEYAYQKSIGRLPALSIAGAACSALAAIGEFAQIFMQDFTGKPLAGAAAALLACASLALCVIVYRQIKRLEWQQNSGEAESIQGQ